MTWQEGIEIDGLDLTKYLKNYAAIGEEYVVILGSIIKKKSLTDALKTKGISSSLVSLLHSSATSLIIP